MKKVFVFIAFSLCQLMPGCAPHLETGTGRTEVREEKLLGEIRKAVLRLAEIANSSEFNQGSQLQEEQIVEALNLGGYTKSYFSIDDFVNLLADYDRHFGRDESFYNATRLAYSYSDGEYAGRFEKQFPELVKKNR